MGIVINFLEYGVRGIWFFLWFLIFMILAFACLGVIGNKQAKKKQADLLEKRKKLAEEEQAKAKAQMEKNAQFGGIDTTLDPTLQKNEETKKEVAPVPAAATPAPVDNTKPIVEENKEEVKEEVPAVLDLDAVSTDATDKPVDNTAPIVEENKEEVKEEVPAVLVINEDGTSG
ncbi:MAG: hypothetical protein IKQ35_01675 [Bacilli bacterium]|nr:hypothetical protein [Bacilli bacterium]